MIIENTFKKRLLAKERMVGSWCMSGAPGIVELMGWTGFDFITIDGEHGPYTLDGLLNSLRALAGTPTDAVVRIENDNPTLIKRVLDIGAQTLLVPMIDTPEQAAAVVAATRYPPEGTRGFAVMQRASRYLSQADYAHTAADNICIIVQIETPLAVQNLEAIAATPGIDAVFVGPGDLSAAMGQVGNPMHEDMLAQVADIAARCAKIGASCGTLYNAADVALRQFEAGYQLVAVSSDLGLLNAAARDLAKKMKA